MPKKNIQEEYAHDTIYDVRLKTIVRVGSIKLLPLDEHHIKGSLLNRIVAENPDAIGSIAKR